AAFGKWRRRRALSARSTRRCNLLRASLSTVQERSMLPIKATAESGRSIRRRAFAEPVAGNGLIGDSGDNGSATSAALHPAAVAVDSAGNLYIADGDHSRIRKVAAASGIITTIAGTGLPGFSGDNGPATAARLNGP